MLNAEIISKRTGEKIANELKLDKENKEVIIYGIFSIIHMLYNILSVAIIGYIFGVAIEAIIVSFVISILRKSSGGAHSKSPIGCLITGTVICLIIGLAAQFKIGIVELILLSIITFIWSYYTIFKLAPVDSPAKPIKTEKKKKRLKKSSIITLTIYLTIIVVSIVIYFYTNLNSLITYSICILGGTIWQVLTITKCGHKIVNLIDTFFNKILDIITRGKRNEKN